MTSTGSVMNASTTLFRFEEHNMVFLSLINGNAGALVPGQEVFIKAGVNNTVDKRTLGSQCPAGIVTVGGGTGLAVTVATPYQRTVEGVAIGGTLAAGDYVVANGVIDGTLTLPQYIKTTTAADFVSGIVISGGTVNTRVRIGLLRSPFKI